MERALKYSMKWKGQISEKQVQPDTPQTEPSPRVNKWIWKGLEEYIQAELGEYLWTGMGLEEGPKGMFT